MFSESSSQHLFEDWFGRSGKRNFEGLVGYARCNFPVPIPQFDFTAHEYNQTRQRQRAR